MKTVNFLKKYSIYTLLAVGILFTGCSDDDDDAPEVENEVEVFTDVKLIFTDDAGGTVTARAQDPDGTGIRELEILDEITLDTAKTYTLTYEIKNNLLTSGSDIGAEILEEDHEHQIFFSFSEGAFAKPTGNGNIDNASDPINYEDIDDNGNPVGLRTTWTTPNTRLSGGSFRVNLQHQPGVKSATTGANDGDTDFDLTFVLNIQ